MLCLAIGYPFAYFMARAKSTAAASAADAGDAALLDLVPAARVCLEGACCPENGWVADAIGTGISTSCWPAPADRRRAS